VTAATARAAHDRTNSNTAPIPPGSPSLPLFQKTTAAAAAKAANTITAAAFSSGFRTLAAGPASAFAAMIRTA